MRINYWKTEKPENHLRPELKKKKFDSLKSWDFGWYLLEPLNIARDEKHEVKLSQQFSKGQKALYFFWFLDAEITNGGFIQFYCNGTDMYLPPIIEGLKLVGHHELLQLIESVEMEYELNKQEFEKQIEKQDIEPLYGNLKKFETFDNKYYEIHDMTMTLIEKYAREHPGEFGKYK